MITIIYRGSLSQTVSKEWENELKANKKCKEESASLVSDTDLSFSRRSQCDDKARYCHSSVEAICTTTQLHSAPRDEKIK